MADQLSWSAVGEWLAGFAPEGPLRTAVLLVYGLCVAVAPFIYKYYLGVLAQGAAPEGLERQDYDALRKGLAGGNLAARLYAKWLTAFLDGVERFFGDAGIEGQRAFWLKKSAPLWTAPAFDRCLLLALLYPIGTIFVIWSISGHVGPAEAVLGLKPDISGWARGLLAGGIGLSCFAFWRFYVTEGWKSFLWFIVAIVGVIPVATAGAGFATIFLTAILSLFLAYAVANISKGAGVSVGALAITFPFWATSVGALLTIVPLAPADHDFAVMLVGVTVIFVGFSVVVFPVALFSNIAIKYRRHGVFLSLFLLATILACLAEAAFLSPLRTWHEAGPMLLFLGLLTLLNAPFDWASLGLTRALLRCGLELGGWWPYLLALVDAALAAVIVVVLALKPLTNWPCMAAASLSCRWTPSSTASRPIQRRRNIGGSMRSCSHP